MNLTSSQAEQILALADRAYAADGCAPLNEEARFAIAGTPAEHLLAEQDGVIVGYLQWQPAFGTGQLVVDPHFRRRGLGGALVEQLIEGLADPTLGLAGSESGEWGLWSFGDLPAAREFAAALGFRPSRTLLVMRRPLADLQPSPIPEGLQLRGFQPGDRDAFLALNAEAFAEHPEQGALDADGLAQRMAEDWFDPDGLLLAFDADGLVGFHWTKLAEPGTGEVYVIGTAARVRGRGYGRVLLDAGLAHLAAAGATEVLLYVDSAEQIPVRMYEGAGFLIDHRDLLYTKPAQENR
ncbi:mycothiol synthase [Propionicimonas paludicola]|uniref:Mycothiol acetyltransferase n=1 Tax=Propionicimonas paludicola TaxID=185243 RepID=A0A2A9CVR7_9ACTN|nr:mycothiol synthase [Propionicimonas paludicola]PFG17679.1 mycothiol synthase [Propionicimonas paludicola]